MHVDLLVMYFFVNTYKLGRQVSVRKQESKDKTDYFINMATNAMFA